eukprot:3088835-Pyramimonas_sp.AAC.1
MGFIEPEITGQLPGHLSPSAGLDFADVLRGLGAPPKGTAAAWAQILAHGTFCGLSQDQSADITAAARNFAFAVLTSSDPAADIANGRLARLAILG